jgi:cytochrome c oxidase assembly protein subunit 15
MENTTKQNKAVAWWLLAGILMIIVQILLGGITRLTGSGLSITEWKPIMGALPPMSDKEWQHAFDGYQNIAQYKYLNNHFTIDDFKFIFFWEWLHRLWARLIGVVFAIGFIYFLVRRYFRKDMITPLIILFVLGGVQGLIGWIMVASGLNDSNLYVNHIKLAIHFVSALVLLCYTLWFAFQLLVPQNQVFTNPALRKAGIALTGVLTLQLIYGAFMAGLKAATYAPTWPGINGALAPATLGSESWVNFPINVHFVHRTLAFLLVAGTAVWYTLALKANTSALFRKTRVLPLLLILLQGLLGVLAVRTAPGIVLGKFGTYELIAEAHQVVAMLFLMTMTLMLYLNRRD